MKRLLDKEWIVAYALILPNSLGLFLLYLMPIAMSFGMSVFSWEGLGGTEFVGAANFVEIMGDAAFWQAVGNTLRYVVVVVPSIVAISLLVALSLNEDGPATPVYRTLFFLPVVTMPVAVAMIWKWLFNLRYGLINTVLLRPFGVEVAWLSDPSRILSAIMIMGVWMGIGFNMVILLSGLKSIPRVYYEAAIIDGANARQRFFSITLPQLSPAIFFVMVIETIKAFQLFDQVYVFVRDNRGQIRDASRTIVMSIYETGFSRFRMGYAATQSIALFVIIFTVTVLQFRMQNRWVNYD